MPDSDWTETGKEGGRVLHCPEFRRMVVEFRGAYLVLRIEEFRRLGSHLRRLAACGPTRSRLAAGERLQLRDAESAGRTLLLDLVGLEELGRLMGIGESLLEFQENPKDLHPVADMLGAESAPGLFPQSR